MGYVAFAWLVEKHRRIAPYRRKCADNASVLRRFRRAGTPFDVRKTASVLITDGPYRFSRNPSYVSLTLLYLGIGTLLNNGWILILVAPVFLVMDLWVVRREERQLETKFGEDYLRYKAAVRRWL